MTAADFTYLIDLPVYRRWENVDLLRTSIVNCFSAIFTETESIYAFATVAAELLENAIKYGHYEDASSKLHLKVWGNAAEAHVQVENPIAGEDNDTRELLRTIDWLKSFPSAEQAYHARLMEVAVASEGVSKLGLARIAYESACEIRAEVDGRILRVSSMTRLS
jgi:hypothetical protein